MPNLQFAISEFGLQAIKPKLYQVPEGSPEEREAVATSLLGTLVYSNLVFEPGAYQLAGEEIRYDGLTINAVLFQVSQEKNVVKTAIQGRSGTIKEYISDGDYQVQIYGTLASPYPDIYPEEDMQTLLKICKAPKAIGVVSEFLQLFEIDDLVIESYTFNQKQGYENIQNFALRCVSDEPVELQLDQSF